MSEKGKRLSPRSKDYKTIYKQVDAYSKEAVEINPHDPGFQFNRGHFLLYKHALGEAVESFLQSIDADPRYVLPYQELRKVIYAILEYGPKEFSDVWKIFIEQMPKIAKRHPLLKEVIKERVEGMKPKNPPAKLSPKDNKVIELIDELKKKSKLD